MLEPNVDNGHRRLISSLFTLIVILGFCGLAIMFASRLAAPPPLVANSINLGANPTGLSTFAGNPNGTVSGAKGDTIWDYSTPALWQCQGGTVWDQVGSVTGAGTSGQVTVWNGASSITGYTGFTTDSSGNVKANSLSVNATAATGAGDIEATTAKISTTANLAGQFQCSNINAQTLGTSQNNWNPAGLATTCRLDITATVATVALTGIVAQPTGTIIAIESDCGNGANDVQLTNLSASSSAANQFDLGASWVLPACSVMTVQYTGANWRAIGWAGTETPPLIIGGALSLTGELLYATPQTNTTTGSQNDVGLNNTTVELIYNGAGSATYTGLTGGASGRFLMIVNESGQTLTLSNLSASSAAQHQFQNFGNVDAVLVGKMSAALYMYVGAVNWQMVSFMSEQNGQPMTFINSANRGTVASGGTATVTAGSICTCADTGAVTSCEASLSSTTLTVTGTAAHNYNYLCF